MIGYGDRTGSANTPEKSISRERTGEIGGTIILSLMSHESTNEEECDTRDSTNRSAIKRLSSTNLEDFGT